MSEQDIKLREFLEQRIQSLEREIKQKISDSEKALSIQAVEYERRLTALNHAHEQAREKERDFISREVFDAFSRTMTARIDQVERLTSISVDRDRLEASLRQINLRFDELSKRISDTERARANLDGRLTAIGGVLLGVSVLINLAISFLAHWGSGK